MRHVLFVFSFIFFGGKLILSNSSFADSAIPQIPAYNSILRIKRQVG